MRSGHIMIALSLLLACGNTSLGEFASFSTNTQMDIELRDQFNAPQRLSFPTTNVVVLAIADRKGAEEVDGWIVALKALYAGRLEFRGLADVAGVPGLFHARVRAHFQKSRKYPVMMDWTGKICARLGYQRGTANILIVDRDGGIRARLYGTANPAAVASARNALEAALSSADSKRPTGAASAGH